MGVMPNGDTDEDSSWSNNDNYDGKYEHFATEAPLLITLVLPVLIGAILIIKCVFGHCCMRQTPTKEELFGVQGRVTALSSDEPVIVVSATPLSSSTPDVNFTLQSALVQSGKRDKSTNDLDAIVGPSVSRQSNRTSSLVLTNETKLIKQALTSVVSAPLSSTSANSIELVHASSFEVLGDVSQDCTDTLKRATLHRQLPEPPQNNVEVQRNARRSNSILSHDETSELYATVGDVPNLPSTSAADSRGPFYDPRAVDKSSGNSNKKRGSKPADTTMSSDSETYANNPSNHPYAKLKRVHEHPYARVGPNRSSVGGDEETDTDNYDTPHPYALAAGGTNAATPGPSRSDNNGNTPATVASASAGPSNAAAENPVPPRRAARLWRRSNNPHVAENQQHFSGDSQDSRGYTSISVREPLSNIIQKGANMRSQDGFYASVSDDSEEMYAAIEDPDANYMRIPGDDPHRPWLNAVAPNLHSPIPERREANSPLPPPPALPVFPTTDNPIETTVPAGEVEPSASNPPVYAQVTKKTKKPKQQSSLTSSQVDSIQPAISIINSSVSSISNEQVMRSSTTVIIGDNVNSVTASTVGLDTGSEAPVSHSSVETPSEPRRWSKADISFSEFEVVREPLYCTPDQNHIAEKRKKKSRSSKPAERNAEPVESASNGFPYVDDDNYNIIPEPIRPPGHSSVASTAPGRKSTKKPKNIYNDVSKEDAVDDYYQEIGPSSSVASNRGRQYNSIRPEALYHQIETPPRRVEALAPDDDDEVGDEFYEAVKPIQKPPPKTGSAAEERYNRKHGYEKLKKKNSDTPVVVAVDDDDDDDEDDDDEDGAPGMYEKLKYPPYARLKESRDSLSIASSAGEESNERNFYETIGYSRTQAKAANSDSTASSLPVAENIDAVRDSQEQPTTSASANVQQLYAVVNKPKKKKKEAPVAVQENGSKDSGDTATESATFGDHVAANGDYSRESRIVYLRDVQDDNSIEYI